jgi:spore coat protein U-like protein
VAALFITEAARAATATGNLPVAATVAAACLISGGALSFGPYDPKGAHSSSPLLATTTLTVVCNSGTSGTISLDEGENADNGSSPTSPRRQMSAGAVSKLSYFLFQDPSRSVPWGGGAAAVVDNATPGSHQLVVYGSIPGNQVIAAGDYIDTVVATITF